MLHPKHLHPRRYVFRGHATGVSAHIRRPDDGFMLAPCSTLPVTGGHTRNDAPRTELGKWVKFDSASSEAHGDYVNSQEGIATTYGGVDLDKYEVETKVAAQVRGLDILGRVQIAEVSLGIVSRNSPGKSESPIRVENNRISGVTIDGVRLNVDLAEDFYQTHDTKTALAQAWAKGLPEEHKRMFLPHKVGVEEVTEFPEAAGTVKCTLVKNLSWDGAPHPTAKIHGHVVEVPEFGKIYFGEMFVTGGSRHVTLVRFQLGSDDGGEVVCGDGDPGPSQPWPPTG
jgi:hypothetical protein